MGQSEKALRTAQKRCGFKQLSLFTKIISSAYMVAWDSPRKAFYRIWIELADDQYSVVKESGIRGRVLNRSSWPAENLEVARTLFYRRIKAKTNPERKSPRKYQLIKDIQKG